jgi:hypothetical protein
LPGPDSTGRDYLQSPRRRERSSMCDQIALGNQRHH